MPGRNADMPTGVVECSSVRETHWRCQQHLSPRQEADSLIPHCQGHPSHKAKDCWPFFPWWSSEKPSLPSSLPPIHPPTHPTNEYSLNTCSVPGPVLDIMAIWPKLEHVDYRNKTPLISLPLLKGKTFAEWLCIMEIWETGRCNS